jgi:hypothetical protein
MKTFFICVFAFCSMTAKAQKEQDKPLSNAERFTARSGTMISVEYEWIANIARCKFEVAHYKDYSDNKKISALRLEYGPNNIVAILDADEVDGFINSINTLKSSVLGTSPANYTEVYYKSRSGFKGGCFSEKGKWTVFLKLSEFQSDSFVSLTLDDLDRLLAALKSAKSKL